MLVRVGACTKAAGGAHLLPLGQLADGPCAVVGDTTELGAPETPPPPGTEWGSGVVDGFALGASPPPKAAAAPAALPMAHGFRVYLSTTTAAPPPPLKTV